MMGNDNDKVVKLLEEIRDVLKDNQSRYERTIQTQKEMNQKHLRTVLIVVIIFLVLALLVVPSI